MPSSQRAEQAHILDAPQGLFTLLRRPFDHRSTLRAWDAADEYLLHHIDEQGLTPHADWLVVNDAFGALACALSAGAVAWHSDSMVSTLATTENLERNDLPAATTVSWPLDGSHHMPTTCSVALIKVPKTLSLLEDQLHQIRPRLTAGATVVAAGMSKHVHTSTLKLFERIIGPTTTSLARKKARLIFATVDAGLTPGPSPHPIGYQTDSGITTVNHAGLFSQAKLDIGTRLLLDTLPRLELGSPSRIVDLGCGNGILGVAAASHFPDADLVFTDESAAAVASAEATWRAHHGDRSSTAQFLHTDILDGVADDSADLVLLNPPFHEDQAVSVSVSPRMFAEASRVLRPAGHLVVVANRHLGYHQHLPRVFPFTKTAASNTKFIVLHATTSRRGSDRHGS